MIQAVIFDIGGVLIRTPNRSSRERLEQRLGLAPWQSEELVFSGRMGTQAQLGQITDHQLWDWIGQHLDLTEQGLEAFRHDFWSGDVLDEDLVEYIRTLRTRYQTAVISNATDALRHNLQAVHGIDDAFELIVCSAEEKVMKPSETIYLRTLERLGRQPHEAVFIDDSPPNVAAARALGMQAVHFTPETELPAELRRLGIY